MKPLQAWTEITELNECPEKGCFITDNQGSLLDNKLENREKFNAFLTTVEKLLIIPEVERLNKLGVSSSINKYVILFDNDKGHPTIKFNEESSFKADFVVKPYFHINKRGPDILFDDVLDIISIEPPCKDGVPVAYILFRKNVCQTSVCFNLRPMHPDFETDEWIEEETRLAKFYITEWLARLFGNLILIIPELSKYDIPFTIGLNSPKMERLCRLIENENTRDSFDDKILEIITDEDILSLFDNWITFQDINNRIDILAEVKKAFEYRLYGCVVTLLMSQVEGVITNKLIQEGMGLRKGKAKNWDDRRIEFDILVKNIYEVGPLTLKLLESTLSFMNQSNLYKPQMWESSTERLNRHGSLHGMDVGFNTRTNAIRMILLFDALYWILLATFMRGRKKID